VTSQSLAIQAASQDPYLRQWAEKQRLALDRGDVLGPSVKTPADVLGERAFLSLGILVSGVDLDGEPISQPIAESMRTSIHAAIPFYWANSVDRIISDLPLPRFVVGPNLLPFPRMWVSLEGEFPMHVYWRGEGIDAPLQAVLIEQSRLGYAFLELAVQPGSDKITVNTQTLKIGDRYPEDVTLKGAIELFLKFLAFANSPYTEIQKLRPGRAERRRATKAGAGVEPEVHVVILRARHQLSVPASETGSRHWQHRWWVRGHFRAQWYPSTQSHNVIWVAPYIKGPDEMPVKAAVYAVVR